MTSFSVHSLLGQLRQLLGARAGDRRSDPELLQRFVHSQDAEAFAILLERHGPLVQRMCQRLLRDTHAAEDAFQATFLVLARKAASVRRPEALGCWLHGVAYRIASRARRQAVPSPVEVDLAVGNEPEPLTELTIREARALLHEALERLPEKLRLPLILCYLEERTRDEAARQLGWPEGTFKRRLERGRELLRQHLGRRGLTISAALLTTVLTECEGEARALPLALKQLTLQSAVRVAGGEALTIVAKATVAQMTEAGLSALRPAKLLVVLGLTLLAAGAGARAIYHEAFAVGDEPSAALATAERPPELPPGPTEHLAPRDPLPDGAVVRLGTLRLRQGGVVSAMDFAPDSRSIVTAGGSRQPIRLWDLRSGKQLQQFGGQAERVRRVLCSSDGKFLVTLDENPLQARGMNFAREETITQWDIATGKVLKQLKLDFHPCALALAPDDRQLAVGGLPGTIQLWDLATGKPLQEIKERDASVDALAFSPDGKYLATGGCFFNADSKAHLWDTGSGKLLRHFAGPDGGVSCCAFSPDGKMLATAGSHRGGSICLWDVAGGKELGRLEGHKNLIVLMRFTNAQTLISAGADNTVRHWQVPTGKELRQTAIRSFHGATALARDGATLATDHGPTFQLWDMAAGKEIPGLVGHRGAVTTLAFVEGGSDLVSAEKDGILRFWDTATGASRRQLTPTQAASTQVLSPNGRLLAAFKDKSIQITDIAGGKQVQTLATVDSGRNEARWLLFSADGTRLVSSSPWGPIQVHDVGTGKELARFGDYPGRLPGRFGPVPRCPFSALALTPDGRILASAEEPYLTQATQVYDTKIRLWDIATGAEFRQIDHKEGVEVLAISADGRSLVSAGWDKTIRIWEMATGRMRHVCKEAQGRTTALALSTDSKTLAWGEESGRVVLFDLSSATVVRALPGHQRPVVSLRFSADGTRLASGSEDTTILLWDVSGRRPAIGRVPAPSPKDLDTLWVDLLEADAAKAWRAMMILARTAEPPYRFLQQHVQPEPGVDPKRLAQLLTDLESNQFAVRQQAEAALEKLGEQAEPELRKLLDAKPPLDTRQRVDKLLTKITSRTYAPETLRGMRVVEVLELLGTPEAKQELERLCRGGANARLTREAQAALERLGLTAGRKTQE